MLHTEMNRVCNSRIDRGDLAQSDDSKAGAGLFGMVVLMMVWVGIAFSASAAAAKEKQTENSATKSSTPAGSTNPQSAKDFWAFQAIKYLSPPPTKDKNWAKTPIDQFVLSKLESNGLRPAPPASRLDLIRRVYFDLVGLPPTPEEAKAFVSDKSPDAYEKLVDRLLNSPRYGEQWGRHWLDVVRYAETEGFEYDRDIPDAWRFRDYVIESFNQDKPYDRFVLEQLAGDEIAPGDHEMQIAAGFHRLGAVRRNAGNQDVASSRNEVLTDRTDIIGAAFLGLTMGCARCHDHKFDPIRQKDYYQLEGFIAATDERNIPLSTPSEMAAWQAKIKSINQEIMRLKRNLRNASEEEKATLRQKIMDLEEDAPAQPASIATIQDVETNRTDIHVLRRGDWLNKGERVGMKGPSILWGDAVSELPPETPNPRSVLAHWITDSKNPLPARVMANRIWLYHFGQGLVKTPNDFGKNGDRPSHPELLDFLARQLIDGGWRIKPLHRMIVLSSVYRQSTTAAEPSAHNLVSVAAGRMENSKLAGKSRTSHEVAGGANLDSENRWLWRYNRRRLEAEEIRDAMLTVSGQLNSKSCGPSVLLPVDPELVAQLYKPSQWIVTPGENSHFCRSVFLIAKRNLRLPFMEVFDQPALLTSCGRRETSTHAPQALELMNGRIANVLAEKFAARLATEAGSDPARQIERASWLAVGRPPTDKERKLALEFLRHQPLKEYALAMFNLNSFLYVN